MTDKKPDFLQCENDGEKRCYPTYIFIGVPLASQTKLNFKTAFFWPLHYGILSYIYIIAML